MRTGSNGVLEQLAGKEQVTEGQQKLLDFLLERGKEGIAMTELFQQSAQIGFTPEDQAGLIKRGLWATKAPNLVVHYFFKEGPLTREYMYVGMNVSNPDGRMPGTISSIGDDGFAVHFDGTRAPVCYDWGFEENLVLRGPRAQLLGDLDELSAKEIAAQITELFEGEGYTVRVQSHSIAQQEEIVRVSCGREEIFFIYPSGISGNRSAELAMPEGGVSLHPNFKPLIDQLRANGASKNTPVLPEEPKRTLRNWLKRMLGV